MLELVLTIVSVLAAIVSVLAAIYSVFLRRKDLPKFKQKKL